MNRHRSNVLAVTVATIPFGLLMAASADAASLQQVNKSDWAGSASLPSYVSMYVYVPDKKATKPPIVVSAHSCGSTASGQMSNITKTVAAADKLGFIIILPDNPGQNCWDTGSSKSLKHDGGGDTQAVAQMVKYALTKYSGDESRVYIFGGSSGGMMTQAMLAVYPDVFRAGSARAGVPAGCWADGYDSGQQWSNSCAGGSVSKSAQQWGDLVRGMYPGYTGHRPRVQLIQGDSDETISYKNMAEAIKEWTNVLGLNETPTSTDTSYKGVDPAPYDRKFWKNDCGATVLEAWSGKGGKHSMKYEEPDILKFFGLDAADTPDPEDDCGERGDSGTGGASGSSGGSAGVGGLSEARDGGKGTGSGGAAMGNGGRVGSGGNRAVGGASGQGGSSGIAGSTGGGGRGGHGGASSSVAKAGSAGTQGSTESSQGSARAGGGGATGSSGDRGGQAGEEAGNAGEDENSKLPQSGGCGCIVGTHAGHSVPTGAALLFALGLLSRAANARNRRAIRTGSASA
jgi:acetylxylan esterase